MKVKKQTQYTITLSEEEYTDLLQCARIARNMDSVSAYGHTGLNATVIQKASNDAFHKLGNVE